MSQNEVYRKRSQAFAIEVIHMTEHLPKSTAGNVLGKQVLRSASSMAINYRAACIGRSKRERFAKLCIVTEEADETVGWLEMIISAGLLSGPSMDALLQESIELSKVFGSYRAAFKRTSDSTHKHTGDNL